MLQNLLHKLFPSTTQKKDLLRKLFPSTIQNIENQAISKGYYKAMDERRESGQQIVDIQAQLLMNIPIIVLTNEWNNPIVGEVIHFDSGKGSPLYYIFDYISNEETCCLSTPIEFSQQKMKIIGKLNPDEICCLFYEGRSHFGDFHKHPTYGKIDKNPFTNYEDWMMKLQTNGFYDRFGTFLEQKEKEALQHWEELQARFM